MSAENKPAMPPESVAMFAPPAVKRPGRRAVANRPARVPPAANNRRLAPAAEPAVRCKPEPVENNKPAAAVELAAWCAAANRLAPAAEPAENNRRPQPAVSKPARAENKPAPAANRAEPAACIVPAR